MESNPYEPKRLRFSKEARERGDTSRLRAAIKDLRDIISQRTPPSFPHRNRLLRQVQEMLDLVPPYDQQSEALDDRERSDPTYWMRR